MPCNIQLYIAMALNGNLFIFIRLSGKLFLLAFWYVTNPKQQQQKPAQSPWYEWMNILNIKFFILFVYIKFRPVSAEGTVGGIYQFPVTIGLCRTTIVTLYHLGIRIVGYLVCEIQLSHMTTFFCASSNVNFRQR